jgi:hypothetical protein
VNKSEINLQLKKFKDERGLIKFDQLLALPAESRIYKMAEKDLGGTIKVITVALTLAMETMNVARRMNPLQILDLAETIVDDCSSDKIALEDLMLFLQKLTRGEYPELYEGIDQVKFMARFNSYRDERWDEGVRIRDEKHEDFKKLGDDNSFERNNVSSPLGDELSRYSKRIQQRNDEIKAMRAEQNRKNQ